MLCWLLLCWLLLWLLLCWLLRMCFVAILHVLCESLSLHFLHCNIGCNGCGTCTCNVFEEVSAHPIEEYETIMSMELMHTSNSRIWEHTPNSKIWERHEHGIIVACTHDGIIVACTHGVLNYLHCPRLHILLKMYHHLNNVVYEITKYLALGTKTHMFVRPCTCL